MAHHCRSAYEWINCSIGSGSVPPMAVQVGADSHGNSIYVGRAQFQGELVPVHVVPAKRAAFVPHYAKEHRIQQCEVLCVSVLKWVPSHGGHVPPGAVQAGHNKDGAPLYVGRAYHEGTQVIGKVHPKFGCCLIPHNGKEVTVNNYETLVYHM